MARLVKNIVSLIAQAVFLLQRGHTDRRTHMNTHKVTALNVPFQSQSEERIARAGIS